MKIQHSLKAEAFCLEDDLLKIEPPYIIYHKCEVVIVCNVLGPYNNYYPV